VAVAAGNGSSFALNDSGVLRSWGNNTNGQLGRNSTVSSHQINIVCDVTGDPGPSNYLTNVNSVSAKGVHCLAMKDDGTVYAWGNNASGQLGDDTSGNNRLRPVQVFSLDLSAPEGINIMYIAIAAAAAVAVIGAVYFFFLRKP
jgi:alpha-tubulin suppressor-like RCC1 family protein